MFRSLKEKQDRKFVLSKHMFQHWQEQISNRESISTSAKNRTNESESQTRSFASRMEPPQYTKTRHSYSTEIRAAKRKHNRAVAFLIKSCRPCSRDQGIKESKRYELTTTDAITSQPKLSSPRYVVCGYVAIVFCMGRSVMNDIPCCNTDSQSTTTTGVESDETASRLQFSIRCTIRRKSTQEYYISV